jgi:tetratricopeptide (TPR) repeat protein
MKHIVPLTDHLLQRARIFQRLGRTEDARRTFLRLAGLRSLPAATAEETQASLADICLKRRRYRQARRHLTAALGHRADHAPHHHRMGQACQADGHGDLRRALEHYRKALAIDPDAPACLLDAGLLAIQLGRSEDGLTWLRRALELAPDDVEVVGKAVRGLGQAGLADEARHILLAALFRNPREPRFRKLRHDFQFQELRRQQELERLNRETSRSVEGPILLPFVPSAAVRRQETDYHGPATLPGPHRSTADDSANGEGQAGCGDSNGS